LSLSLLARIAIRFRPQIRRNAKRWCADAFSHDLLERDTTVAGEFTVQQHTFCFLVLDHIGQPEQFGMPFIGQGERVTFVEQVSEPCLNIRWDRVMDSLEHSAFIV
jgi:hypothetical protein